MDFFSLNCDQRALIARSIVLSVDRSLDIACSPDRSFDHSVACWIAWSLDWSTDRSFARSIAWSLTRSLDRSLGRSIVTPRSLDRLIAGSIARSLNRKHACPFNRSLEPSGTFDWRTEPILDLYRAWGIVNLWISISSNLGHMAAEIEKSWTYVCRARTILDRCVSNLINIGFVSVELEQSRICECWNLDITRMSSLSNLWLLGCRTWLCVSWWQQMHHGNSICANAKAHGLSPQHMRFCLT